MTRKLIGPILPAKEQAKFFMEGGVLECAPLNKLLMRPDVKDGLCWFEYDGRYLFVVGKWSFNINMHPSGIKYKRVVNDDSRETMVMVRWESGGVHLPKSSVYPIDVNGLLTSSLETLESQMLGDLGGLRANLVAVCNNLESAHVQVAYDQCIQLLDLVLHLQSCHCTNDEIVLEINEYLVARGMAPADLAPQLMAIQAGEHDSWEWKVKVGDRVEQGQALAGPLRQLQQQQQMQPVTSRTWPARSPCMGRLAGKIKQDETHVQPGEVIGYVKPL